MTDAQKTPVKYVRLGNSGLRVSAPIVCLSFVGVEATRLTVSAVRCYELWL